MNRILFVVLGDFVAFWTAFFIVLSIRFREFFPIEVIKTHFIPFIILCLFWILCFFLFGLYDLFKIKPTIPHLKRFGIALIICFIIGIFLFYFVYIFGISPKTNLLFQIICFGSFSLLFRRLIYSFFSKQIVRPVIIIGKTLYLNELYETIKKNPQLGLVVISYNDDFHESIKKYSDLKNSVFVFEKNSSLISEIDIINLYKNKIEIIDITTAYEKYLFKIPTDCISQSWIIENINTRNTLLYNLISRLLSIIFSLFIIILSLPILIISSLFIYFYDYGPILYVQKRVGLNGKIFDFYKLRSMNLDSEKNGPTWTAKNDPRITPVGKILRKLHIDEIPQMINILKGDLSFIGPRPEWIEFVKIYRTSIPYYNLRHVIRPGFTGWAQIKYRYTSNVEDTKEKFKYDLYYIKNKNIFMDFGIILRTIIIIFTHN